MPSEPEEKGSQDVDIAAVSSAVVMGPVSSGGSRSGETVVTSSSSMIDDCLVP